jgi:uncharacterized protein (TIGR01777 family)
MRIAILGASGFIGRHLVSALRARGDEIVAASLRNPLAAADAAADCDTIVNVAGEPISQRWSAQAKERIESSRTAAPRAFLEALSTRKPKATAYVSASAIGYYGTSETATFTETDSPGDDFLARVCIGWEREANRASELGMRVSIVRNGVALGIDGGALKALLPPFRTGAGGIVGDGRQWFSWIHIEDLIAIYLRAIGGGEGVTNGTAPQPVTNAEFTQTLAHVLHRLAIVPVPTIALRIMFGEGADMVLRGQRVVPARLGSEHFTFEYPTIERALNGLLH